MKNKLEKLLRKTEKGQAIILIAFAFIGLVAMVGLVTDTGIMLIEYGKIKRSVDAASIAAAQEYRPRANATELDLDRLENAAISILNLNQVQNLSNIQIHTCEPTDPDRPALCNPNPVGNPMANRKLVSVTASSNVDFGFLRVIGIRSATLTASSIGEAATIDLVLVMDTSGGMAYQTGNETYDPNATPPIDTYVRSDLDDDPKVCNANGDCEPMRVVKNVAWDFVSRLYYPYDRVSIITLTSQTAGGLRNPQELIPLTSDRGTIEHEIAGVKVFQPRDCIGDLDHDEDVDLDDLDAAGSSAMKGSCLNYDAFGNFQGEICQSYEIQMNAVIDYVNAGGSLPSNSLALPDPSSCPSSNIGGALKLARDALLGSGNPATVRPKAFWVVVGLFGGGANATDELAPNYLSGFCPLNTWLIAPDLNINQGPWCIDPNLTPRHTDSDMMTYTNPVNGHTDTFTLFDADDYARFWGDELAGTVSGNGVTIYTIGLGRSIQNVGKDNGVTLANDFKPAEDLLTYIAEDAGGTSVNHGQYFFAQTSSELSSIFEKIAQNIATKISQ